MTSIFCRIAFRLMGGLMIGGGPMSAFAATEGLSQLAQFRLLTPAAQAMMATQAGLDLSDGDDASAMIGRPEIAVSEAEPYAPLPYGPIDPMAADASPDPAQFRGFGRQLGAVKWEMALILGYYTAINGSKLFDDPTAPHVHKEGWFGKSTKNLGVDKLAHAYSTYLVSELIYGRLKRNTGDAPGIAVTAAALAAGTSLYTEFWDSIERSSGWSWEDLAFNSMGAGFSVLRNSVPGLDKTLDFRLMMVPNSDIMTLKGKRHFEQQRYFLALKLAGFKRFDDSPLRFLELHAGYYAKDFTNKERALGIEPKRRIFVGVGLNFREVFFKNARRPGGRAAGEVLDYFQPPYTAAHRHITN